MKISFRIVLVFFFNCQFIFAQNIVPNGDFENYTILPSGSGQWGYCVGWGNSSGSGSPDYFHLLGSFSAALPNNIFASVMPFSGQAIMGFAAMSTPGTNYREYPSIQLSSAMEIGSTYSVSFNVTNGEANHNFGYSCNRLGIRFSEGSLTQLNGSPIGGVPQLELSGQIWSTTWQTVNFNFIADSAYTHLTIGNFYNDISTSHMSQVQAETSEGVYYFIDDVSVERNPIANIDNHADEVFLTVYPNPTKNNFIIEVESISALIESVNIEVYDNLGRTIQVGSISKDGSGKTKISLDGYVMGTYFVKCFSNSFEKHFKVIKL